MIMHSADAARLFSRSEKNLCGDGDVCDESMNDRGRKEIEKKKKDMKDMTDRAAHGSVPLESWIAHALGQRLLLLARRVRVANVHFQTGHLCVQDNREL